MLPFPLHKNGRGTCLVQTRLWTLELQLTKKQKQSQCLLTTWALEVLKWGGGVMAEIRKSIFAYFCHVKLQILETSVTNLFKIRNVCDIHSIILLFGDLW